MLPHLFKTKKSQKLIFNLTYLDYFEYILQLIFVLIFFVETFSCPSLAGKPKLIFVQACQVKKCCLYESFLRKNKLYILHFKTSFVQDIWNWIAIPRRMFVKACRRFRVSTVFVRFIWTVNFAVPGHPSSSPSPLSQ